MDFGFPLDTNFFPPQKSLFLTKVFPVKVLSPIHRVCHSFSHVYLCIYVFMYLWMFMIVNVIYVTEDWRALVFTVVLAFNYLIHFLLVITDLGCSFAWVASYFYQELKNELLVKECWYNCSSIAFSSFTNALNRTEIRCKHVWTLAMNMQY